MHRYLLTLLILTLYIIQPVFAQDSTNLVLITVNANGKTKKDAIQKALRSAIEQAFGSYISLKTEVLDDKLVKDELISVTNGNIQSYDVISEVQIPEGDYAITLKALISISNLTNFCESKGIAVEIKGGLFVANIKQQQLNEQAESKAIANLISVSYKILSKSIDYDLQTSEELYAVPEEPNNFILPIQVTYKTNENQKIFYDYFISSLKSISMSKEEYNKYYDLKKPIQCIITPEGDLYLRNPESILILKLFTIISNKIIFDFVVASEVDTCRISDYQIEGQSGTFYNAYFFEKFYFIEDKKIDMWEFTINPLFNAGCQGKSNFYSGLLYYTYWNNHGPWSFINEWNLFNQRDKTEKKRIYEDNFYIDKWQNSSESSECDYIEALTVKPNTGTSGILHIDHKLSLSQLEKISSYKVLHSENLVLPTFTF
jgi:hypothetical protein